MLQDEDPCLVSTMTESILPLIPERGPGSGGHPGHNNNNTISSKQGGASVGTQVMVLISAANRLIVEVVQSRRRPLLGPSPG